MESPDYVGTLKMDSGKFPVQISVLPKELRDLASAKFDEMYAVGDKAEDSILMWREQLQVKRRYKTYIHAQRFDEGEHYSYMFSGDKNFVAEPLPKVFAPFFDYICANHNIVNNVTVNWYDNGENYIAMHTDKFHQIDEEIHVLTFMEDTNEARKFVIAPSRQHMEPENTLLKVEIPAYHGRIITMRKNHTFLHGVPKDDTKSRRISIAFRWHFTGHFAAFPWNGK